jgi:hypothetical protein
MQRQNGKFRTRVLSLAGAAALAVSFNARADLINGLVDIWTVNVNTIFDTTSICGTLGCAPGPTGVTVNNNQSLSWGTSTGFGQSGLAITNSPSNANVNTNGAAVPNVTITHFNQPITGDVLRSLNILSTLTLTPFAPPGPGLPSTTISFPVNYLETPNGANPCADGGVNGVGVNSNGCADIYVTSNTSLNFPFFYDLDGPGGVYSPQQYFISFFEATNGLTPLSAAACAAVGVASPCLGFETPEGANTPVRFASLITTQRVSIPEPGSMALVGLALAAFGVGRRKSR